MIHASVAAGEGAGSSGTHGERRAKSIALLEHCTHASLAVSRSALGELAGGMFGTHRVGGSGSIGCGSCVLVMFRGAAKLTRSLQLQDC